jgi:hypothetical protein
MCDPQAYSVHAGDVPYSYFPILYPSLTHYLHSLNAALLLFTDHVGCAIPLWPPLTFTFTRITPLASSAS